ncbi:MAG: hypothetical protein KIG36_07210 [Eubacteriales bacterium]|nr:hypothetical protein [Eubacteriales bacterium]
MKKTIFTILIYFLIVVLAVNLGAASVNTPALFVSMRLAGADLVTARVVTGAVMLAVMAFVTVWALKKRFYPVRVVTFAICYGVALLAMLITRLALI